MISYDGSFQPRAGPEELYLLHARNPLWMFQCAIATPSLGEQKLYNLPQDKFATSDDQIDQTFHSMAGTDNSTLTDRARVRAFISQAFQR